MPPRRSRVIEQPPAPTIWCSFARGNTLLIQQLQLVECVVHSGLLVKKPEESPRVEDS